MIFQNVALRTNRILLSNIQTKLLRYGATSNYFLTREFTKSGTINRTIENCNNLKAYHSFNRYNFIKPVNMRQQSTSEEKPKEKDKKESKEDIIPLTKVQKLKKAVTEYGSTVIVFHVGISLLSLGSCYLLVSAGLDTAKVFTALGLDNWANNSAIAANAGTFAVAYAVHKVFAPVRITITLASIPFIVRYLRRIGFLKK